METRCGGADTTWQSIKRGMTDGQHSITSEKQKIPAFSPSRKLRLTFRFRGELLYCPETEFHPMQNLFREVPRENIPDCGMWPGGITDRLVRGMCAMPGSDPARRPPGRG